MINRSAVILRYKEPVVRWINEADPIEENPGITLEDANEDRTVYLITEDEGENVEKWVKANYKILFENELEDWYTDKSLWPKKRDRRTFNEWFAVEHHTVIIDTVREPIEDDEP